MQRSGYCLLLYSRGFCKRRMHTETPVLRRCGSDGTLHAGCFCSRRFIAGLSSRPLCRAPSQLTDSFLFRCFPRGFFRTFSIGYLLAISSSPWRVVILVKTNSTTDSEGSRVGKPANFRGPYRIHFDSSSPCTGCAVSLPKNLAAECRCYVAARFDKVDVTIERCTPWVTLVGFFELDSAKRGFLSQA